MLGIFLGQTAHEFDFNARKARLILDLSRAVLRDAKSRADLDQSQRIFHKAAGFIQQVEPLASSPRQTAVLTQLLKDAGAFQRNFAQRQATYMTDVAGMSWMGAFKPPLPSFVPGDDPGEEGERPGFRPSVPGEEPFFELHPLLSRTVDSAQKFLNMGEENMANQAIAQSKALLATIFKRFPGEFGFDKTLPERQQLISVEAQMMTTLPTIKKVQKTLQAFRTLTMGFHHKDRAELEKDISLLETMIERYRESGVLNDKQANTLFQNLTNMATFARSRYGPVSRKPLPPLEGFMGIRTAAAKKKGRPPREIVETLVVDKIAQRVKREFPQITRLHLVGSRLRHRYSRDVEFVAVIDDEENMPARTAVDVFDGVPMKVDVFFSLPDEVETHILEFGLGLDNIRWKKKARKKGYKLSRFGLFKGPVLVSQNMAEIAQILGMPLKPFLVYTLENPL